MISRGFVFVRAGGASLTTRRHRLMGAVRDLQAILALLSDH